MGQGKTNGMVGENNPLDFLKDALTIIKNLKK
jgi:hypothetical protein